MQQNQLAL
jgi:hypothetical protein